MHVSVRYQLSYIGDIKDRKHLKMLIWNYFFMQFKNNLLQLNLIKAILMSIAVREWYFWCSLICYQFIIYKPQLFQIIAWLPCEINNFTVGVVVVTVFFIYVSIEISGFLSQILSNHDFFPKVSRFYISSCRWIFRPVQTDMDGTNKRLWKWAINKGAQRSPHYMLSKRGQSSGQLYLKRNVIANNMYDLSSPQFLIFTGIYYLPGMPEWQVHQRRNIPELVVAVSCNALLHEAVNVTWRSKYDERLVWDGGCRETLENAAGSNSQLALTLRSATGSCGYVVITKLPNDVTSLVGCQ